MAAILKIYFSFFSWTEKPIDLKLGRKLCGDVFADKKSKPVSIGIPGWPQCRTSWKSNFHFSLTEGANDSNLGRKL